MAAERNLILVAEGGRHMDPTDFQRIAEEIRASSNTIEVFVVENGALNMRAARRAADRPTGRRSSCALPRLTCSGRGADGFFRDK